LNLFLVTSFSIGGRGTVGIVAMLLAMTAHVFLALLTSCVASVNMLAMEKSMVVVAYNLLNYSPFIAATFVLASSLKKFHRPICLSVSTLGIPVALQLRCA